MKLNFKKSILLSVLALYAANGFAQQIYVNEEWNVTSTNVSAVNRVTSVVDGSRNLIVVTNKMNTSNNADVLVSKYDSGGTLLWEHSFDGDYNGDDYGVQVALNGNDDIFVAAVIEQSSGTDFGIMKYSASGTLQWIRYWDGTAGVNDVPADIKIDSYGDVYVVGGSEATNGNSDYAIVKYNTDGVFQWDQHYDYAELHDGATSVDVRATSTIVVTGGSASAADSWDFATMKLNKSDGSINGVERTVVAGVGLDKAVSIASDQNNNVYISGQVEINGKFEIQVVKLNPNFGFEWVKNFSGGYNDIVKDIGVDALGNVYISGESENSNGGLDFITIKYDSSGNELWNRLYGSGGSNFTAQPADLWISDNGDVFVTGTVDKYGVKEFATLKYDTNGDFKLLRKFDAGYQNNEATAINIVDNDIFVSGMSEVNGVPKSVSVKYSVVEKTMNFVYDTNGDPIYEANDLIVRFDTSAILKENIDKVGFQAGVLEDFLKPTAAADVKNAVKSYCPKCDIKVYKIFRTLTTDDTTTISRLGETIPIPHFWATLLLEFPSGVDVTQVSNELESLFPLVKYTDLNFVIKENSVPDDTHYNSEQSSLHPTQLYPAAHINMEPAWEIETGKPFVKVGVFDHGIEWAHEDFGDGTVTGTKVDGWNCVDNTSTYAAVPLIKSHGSSSAGIIGAIRNNNKGIAGIAGGSNNSVHNIDSMGVSLFDMRILGPYSSPLTNVADGIITSSIEDTSLNYGYGLHIMNNSYGFTDSLTTYYNSLDIMTEAVHFANRAKVVFVASRGNAGDNSKQIPATIDGDWVLCVGATGTDGQFVVDGLNGGYNPSYGTEVDVSAPGANANVYTLDFNNTYVTFNGTSASAPHVTGVASLLLSYYNHDTAHYDNLAPEDVEQILQMTATDCNYLPPDNLVGPDTLTGYGRINAYQALVQIDKNKYHLDHFGTDNTNFSKAVVLISTNDTLMLTENFENGQSQWFLANTKYVVNTYEVTSIVHHNLPVSDSILSYWPRPSSSNVFLAPNANNKVEPRERIIIDNMSLSSASLRGYVYQVSDTLGNFLGWWPIDTAFTSPQFTYTVLSYDPSVYANTPELDINQQVLIYPNPTNQSQTIYLNLPTDSQVDIQLLDISGRLVFDVYEGNTPQGSAAIPVSLANLSNGIYVYQIKINDEVINKKIIKNN